MTAHEIAIRDFKILKYKMEKKLYFTLSDNGEISGITMTLDGCMEWIKNDEHTEGDNVEYTITPVWMTEEEFNNMPEAEI